MRRLVYLAILLQGWSSAVCAQEVSVAKESPPIGPLPAERLARKIEPDLTGRPERVQQYVDFFRRELFPPAVGMIPAPNRENGHHDEQRP